MATHMFFRHPVYSYQGLITRYSYTNMSFHVKKESFNGIIEDKWILPYLQQSKRYKNDSEVFKHFDNKTTLDQYYIESMVLLVWYLNPSISISYLGIAGTWAWIENNLDVLYSNRFFYPIKDRTYLFKHAKTLLQHLNNTNTCQEIKCFPGFEPAYETFYDANADVERFNWRCVKCRFNTVKSGFNRKYCQKCEVPLSSDSNRSYCFDPYVLVHLNINDIAVIVIIIITILE